MEISAQKHWISVGIRNFVSDVGRKEGITGNDHFMFQDLNNDVIADHIENWIEKNVE